MARTANFRALVNVLHTTGKLDTIRQRTLEAENRCLVPPKDPVTFRRVVFEGYAGIEIRNNPSVLRLVNRAAQDAVMDALFMVCFPESPDPNPVPPTMQPPAAKAPAGNAEIVGILHKMIDDLFPTKTTDNEGRK